jgi:hypothetical protein
LYSCASLPPRGETGRDGTAPHIGFNPKGQGETGAERLKLWENFGLEKAARMVIGFRNMRTQRWHYRIDRRRIGYLRFLLEGYDGIAVLETLDPVAGRVALHVAPGCEPDVRALLTALKGEFPMTRLAPFPEDGPAEAGG